MAVGGRWLFTTRLTLCWMRWQYIGRLKGWEHDGAPFGRLITMINVTYTFISQNCVTSYILIGRIKIMQEPDSGWNDDVFSLTLSKNKFSISSWKGSWDKLLLSVAEDKLHIICLKLLFITSPSGAGILTFAAQCCHMGTAIKHSALDRVKP